ncbi:MAG: serine--tRNA ligase, partial [Alphaproteobacteria bacterium]|nr:serine--tRNA ligase [Alphaproteobacteria bacterium]
MHDIDFIRKNTDKFIEAMKRRGLPEQAEKILKIDAMRRNAQTKRDELLAQRNQLSQEIGVIKKNGGDAESLMYQVKGLKNDIEQFENQEQTYQQQLHAILEILPNIPDDSVPDGADENDNVEVRRFLEAEMPDFTPAQHFDIGENLGLLDFKRAAQLSGARFAIKYGDLARLERAIANFMLDTHTAEHGYTEIDVPILAKSSTLYGSGHLPKFTEDLYKIEGQDLWLIPTSETMLANYAAEQILPAEKLPIRLTAWTQCFRSEAGAAGRDTRGLIRMHQFSKVEMVSITAPDESFNELDRMTECAETILKKLELPFRTVALCVGDMGFAATKTYDIEVWLAGAGAYREISSCSNCLDFQSRRMNARAKAASDKGTHFPHMLNGSGLAVGRTMVAILENYQNQDGTVTIPTALRNYMGGKTLLSPA